MSDDLVEVVGDIMIGAGFIARGIRATLDCSTIIPRISFACPTGAAEVGQACLLAGMHRVVIMKIDRPPTRLVGVDGQDIEIVDAKVTFDHIS